MAVRDEACALRSEQAVIRVGGCGRRRYARDATWGPWAATSATRGVCRRGDGLLPSRSRERDCRDSVRLLLVAEALQGRRMQLSVHKRQR